MLDWARENGVRDAGEGTRGVVLREREGGSGVISALEIAACVVEATKLDRDAGTDADEGRERALVEGCATFLGIDLPG